MKARKAELKTKVGGRMKDQPGGQERRRAG